MHKEHVMFSWLPKHHIYRYVHEKILKLLITKSFDQNQNWSETVLVKRFLYGI